MKLASKDKNLVKKEKQTKLNQGYNLNIEKKKCC